MHMRTTWKHREPQYLHKRHCFLTHGPSRFSQPVHSLVEADSAGQLLHCLQEKNMPWINIVVTLIVVGIVLGMINRYIPMASSIKSILNAVVVVGLCRVFVRQQG
jgi:hypothetical protein